MHTAAKFFYIYMYLYTDAHSPLKPTSTHAHCSQVLTEEREGCEETVVDEEEEEEEEEVGEEQEISPCR